MWRNKSFGKKGNRKKRFAPLALETESVLQVRPICALMADKLKVICDVVEDYQKQIAEILPDAMEQATRELHEKAEELKQLEEYEHEQQDEG